MRYPVRHGYRVVTIGSQENRSASFLEYVEWAKEQGCVVNEERLLNNDGQQFNRVMLTSPEGRWVVEVTAPDDYLISTTVARLDRRLGLKSSFF